MLRKDLWSLSRLQWKLFLLLTVIGMLMYYMGYYTIIHEHTTKFVYTLNSKGRLENLPRSEGGISVKDVRISPELRMRNGSSHMVDRNAEESDKEPTPEDAGDDEYLTDIQINENTSLSRDVDVGEGDLGEESTACVFPYVNPFDPKIMAMSGLELKTLECRSNLPDLVYIQGNRLAINKTKVLVKLGGIKVTCRYQDVIQGRDNLGTFSPPFNDLQVLADNAEFIKVLCEDDRKKVVSLMYFALIPKQDTLLEVESLLLKKREMESAPKETLNVVMIGVDSVSRYHFMRSMTKTYPYLMDELGSFDMSMYTQVGKNTFPNYVPLLSGRSEEEINAWWDFSKYADGFDLVWGDYARAGYRTLYTEDWPSIGVFNYEKKGFRVNPTTHYSRPLCVVMERDKEIWNTDGQCVGEQPEVNFHFDYIKRLFDTFKEKPLYAMAFLTKISHDHLIKIKMADEHVFNFYRQLQESGYLNNTLLITFSDHGPRWGPIRSSSNGMYEARTPFAIFTFPMWFLEKYPDVAENLEKNTHRLTTHYDTHATLVDLLYFQGNGDAPVRRSKHGISLMQRIPKNRTCKDVPIPEEFCLCGQTTMEKLDIASKAAQILADQTVDVINSRMNKTMCAALKLDKILLAVSVELPKNVSEGQRNTYLFKVRVKTTPGHGIFEATVFLREGGHQNLFWGNESSVNVEVAERIDRLNMYRGQADCVRDARQKEFCYCKHLL